MPFAIASGGQPGLTRATERGGEFSIGWGGGSLTQHLPLVTPDRTVHQPPGFDVEGGEAQGAQRVLTGGRNVPAEQRPPAPNLQPVPRRLPRPLRLGRGL